MEGVLSCVRGKDHYVQHCEPNIDHPRVYLRQYCQTDSSVAVAEWSLVVAAPSVQASSFVVEEGRKKNK